MAASPENVSMALFCDFENVALGVRDAKFEKFDIKLVLERLLLKGSIVVKKAYCDWDRYKGFKATMHEANFELIEIPHVRQSGKNSADIRLVVDALDLCYTKSHVNTFVIISGDSDFSPLVSKLRENAKQVIGVGVKQSTSDLLIANCDEFIFYDDLVRETQRVAARREPKEAQPARRAPEDDSRRKEEIEARKTRGIEIAVQTFDALVAERGDSGKIWASVLKEAIKRRKPDFSETRYGFRAFGNLLEEAQSRGLLEFGRDEKSGAYVYRSAGSPVRSEPVAEMQVLDLTAEAPVIEQPAAKPEGRRSGRGGRKAAADGASSEQGAAKPENRRKGRGGRQVAAETPVEAPVEAPAESASQPAPVAAEAAPTEPEAKPVKDTRRKSRSPRKAAATEPEVPPAEAAAPEVAAAPEAPAKPARKPAARSRRPRKTEE
ncbi:NYN domain-containing protein [Zoogloea sp.]|uniref:NYN domain-containing protein n=1 Tax=Zoogloea sp. TaxID=49181 RepID=UPI00262BEDCE|nr:NYN domain-containing protein [Zoogloea sp.]